MNSKLKDWINAAKILRDDPQAQVKCPECGRGFLHAEDVYVKEVNKIDRYLICDICKKRNVVTFAL